MTWCIQRPSARTGAGARCRSRVSWLVSKWPARLSAATAARSARSAGRRVSWRAAASAAASDCRSSTIRASRMTSSRSEANCSVLGGTTPSSRASCPACSTATGVRSSCATSATRSRRSCSCRASASAILSKVRARSTSSTGPRTLPTRAPASPAAHRAGRVDQPDHRPGDAPGHNDRDQQGQQRGQARRAGDGPPELAAQPLVGPADAVAVTGPSAGRSAARPPRSASGSRGPSPAAKPGVRSTVRPAGSVTRTFAPIWRARSVAGIRLAGVQRPASL